MPHICASADISRRSVLFPCRLAPSLLDFCLFLMHLSVPDYSFLPDFSFCFCFTILLMTHLFLKCFPSAFPSISLMSFPHPSYVFLLFPFTFFLLAKSLSFSSSLFLFFDAPQFSLPHSSSILASPHPRISLLIGIRRLPSILLIYLTPGFGSLRVGK